MNKLAMTVARRLIYSILIFIVFAYLTVFVCSIPVNFTMGFVNGKLISSHTFGELIGYVNNNIHLIITGRFSATYRNIDQTKFFLDKLIMTIKLLLCGILLGIILGVLKGIFDSSRGKYKNGNLRVLLSIIPISIPDILSIALLQYLAIVLAKHGIKIVKVAGAGTVNHMILPIIALSLLPACYIARVTAISIDECYNSAYVKTALGKGCTNRRILWNHIMRNVLGVVFESLSNITALIICNLVLVEYLFAYRGISSSIQTFYSINDMTGVISSIILIGIIFLLLDNLFQILKRITYKPIKEEGI